MAVLDAVVSQVRLSDRLSDALDAYPEGRSNVECKWFSRLKGYEVDLRFGAGPLSVATDLEGEGHV